MPTDEQLRRYASSLPRIYREILEAFPRLTPYRREGDGLALMNLDDDLESRGNAYGMGEIEAALGNLASAGITEIRKRIYLHPTPVGERLVKIVAEDLQPVKVDPLPPFPE